MDTNNKKRAATRKVVQISKPPGTKPSSMKAIGAKKTRKCKAETKSRHRALKLMGYNWSNLVTSNMKLLDSKMVPLRISHLDIYTIRRLKLQALNLQALRGLTYKHAMNVIADIYMRNVGLQDIHTLADAAAADMTDQLGGYKAGPICKTIGPIKLLNNHSIEPNHSSPGYITIATPRPDRIASVKVEKRNGDKVRKTDSPPILTLTTNSNPMASIDGISSRIVC